ncbi:MAG: P-loop NTPase family protein [Leptolyngbyaceae cyanobacterium SM1_1_3]|nr:P-loop NTPase family protein [Leptolyngbyaceae cyanobacterium SM1_1_3]NJN02815.1 P-loop NTPase family protein [Leptolyngbyaceae cyanobacterium RM1_1_2]NJO10531.1 P-loop NTPase family protein [Leptolyngbyaceae cyanobacterium SL_1_1]
MSQLGVSAPISVPLQTGDRVHPLFQSLEGTIQVFTSVQRNFFTNVMVQALRAAGQGTPVLVVQFLKGGIQQGPAYPVQLGQNLDWVRCGLAGCVHPEAVDAAAAAALNELWLQTQARVMQGQYALVVLDELSLAVKLGLIAESSVLAFLRDRPAQVDVVLTGPEMPAAILEMADQVTQLRRNFLI